MYHAFVLSLVPVVGRFGFASVLLCYWMPPLFPKYKVVLGKYTFFNNLMLYFCDTLTYYLCFLSNPSLITFIITRLTKVVKYWEV